MTQAGTIDLQAIRRFDEENGRDPHRVVAEGGSHPRELYYSRKLADWVGRLAPSASRALRLAARCQHLCRWSIPRNSYPMDRAGYLKWRSDLKQFHAQKAGEILKEVGCDPALIAQVQDLNLKKNFPKDPESQILEDALCLVFLECQFSELAAKTDAAKMGEILKKTWKKMSELGRQAALKLSYSDADRRLLEQALLGE